MKKLFICLLLAACSPHGADYQKIQPAAVRMDEQGKYVELTKEAVQRLDVQAQPHEPGQPIPLSALLYDSQGNNFVYFRDVRGLYRRRLVQVLSQDLKNFIPSNNLHRAAVVIQGAAELAGTEEGVGK
jgi:hypothetical protein